MFAPLYREATTTCQREKSRFCSMEARTWTSPHQPEIDQKHVRMQPKLVLNLSQHFQMTFLSCYEVKLDQQKVDKSGQDVDKCVHFQDVDILLVANRRVLVVLTAAENDEPSTMRTSGGATDGWCVVP
jgi:hypothetical protein